jgi:L-threonylcarbamoyladenylate synthase
MFWRITRGISPPEEEGKSKRMDSRMQPSLSRAVEILWAGGVLVYPTETFYAMGGDAASPRTAERVEAMKSRPAGKPFPVIIGSWELLWSVADRLPPQEEKVARCFWPGPLSLLIPGRSDLPDQVRGSEGTICVRWSSHPLAALLSRESSRALIATSANLSEQPPVSRPWSVNEQLAMHSDVMIDDEPWPAGGVPSTIVSCDGQGVRILRPGAVSRLALEQKGFEVIGPVF